MSEPSVSVLMTVYNGAAYLRESLSSILAQTHSDFEFLIIDDGSTDGSVKLIESIRDTRIRLIANPMNKGQTPCLNEGLRLARGEFIARQDADDFSDPRRLELQIAFLRNNPDTALVGSQGWLVDHLDVRLARIDFPLRAEGIRWFHLFDNAFLHAAVMFRLSAIAACGEYDDSFTICQDYDLWARIMNRFPVANLEERLIRYRFHESSLSQKGRTAFVSDVTRVLKRELAARFPGTPFSEEEIDLLVLCRTRLGAVKTGAFKTLMQKLLALQPDPAVAAHPDFSRALSIQYAKTGYNLLPGNKLQAVSFYKAALKANPGYVLTLPWPRILALAFLGDLARRIYLRLMAPSHASQNPGES